MRQARNRNRGEEGRSREERWRWESGGGSCAAGRKRWRWWLMCCYGGGRVGFGLRMSGGEQRRPSVGVGFGLRQWPSVGERRRQLPCTRGERVAAVAPVPSGGSRAESGRKVRAEGSGRDGPIWAYFDL